MRRRILLVNFDFPPLQGPGIWRTLGFATHLPALGWDVSVFCSDRNPWHNRTEPGLLNRLSPEVRIHRVKGRSAGAFAGRFLPSRAVLAWRKLLPNPLLVPAMKLAAKAMVHAPREPFAVLTSGPPHISHLVGLVLKRTRRCVWIADFRDLWMDDPIQAWPGWYQPGLGRAVEQAVLRNADAVMTVTRTWAALLGEKAARPVAMIRNASDTDEQALPPPERPWPHSDRVLLFAGTPQRNNTTDDLWLGIRKYLDTLPAGQAPIRFVFLGLDPEIRNNISRLGIAERIEDLGPQPQERAAALLRGADAALIPIKAAGTAASRGTVPAKIYLAVALAKPIVLLADCDSEAAALLADYPHTFAPSDNPDAIAAALHRFNAEPTGLRAPCPPSELAGWSRFTAAAALDRLIAGLDPAFAPARSVADLSPEPELPPA